MRKIEICCTSVADALEAEKGGAIRIELCTAISSGGVTPSFGLVKEAVSAVGGAEGIDVNVLIRASEGNFCYSSSQIKVMTEDIRLCRQLGADGVVIGALTPDGKIDIDACKEMVEAAGDMSITFHRAFDACINPFEALEQIICLGCDRILTSGQKPTATEGAGLLSELVRKADGRIIIMPGSGVNPANISELERITRASEFHSTARKPVRDLCRHHAPELGFDEPSPGDGLVLRTHSDIVRKLVQTL